MDSEWEYETEVENEGMTDSEFKAWVEENAKELAREAAEKEGTTFEEVGRNGTRRTPWRRFGFLGQAHGDLQAFPSRKVHKGHSLTPQTFSVITLFSGASNPSMFWSSKYPGILSPDPSQTMSPASVS